MARIDFYRLSRDPAARVAPMLADRVMAGGDRLIVVGDAALLAAVSEALWGHKPAAFLAHGMDGDASAADEPILLATGLSPNAANGAQMALLADGVWRDEALNYARCFFLFDTGGIDAARATWRSLAAHEGAERHFWTQDERGRWTEGP